MADLETFDLYQRVRVKRVGDILVHREGTVVRLRRCDDGAWIDLAVRLSGGAEMAHPFPADDATRSTHVLAYPMDCEALSD